MERALDHVVTHHDALRTRVIGKGPDAALHHDSSGPLPTITRIDLSEVAPENRPRTIEQAATTAQAGLDLKRGALVAAVHFDCGAAPGRLLLAIHHVAVDGVSWRLLIEDLEAAYRALDQGSPVQLPPRTAAFGRWSEALAACAATADVSDSLPRWLEIEAQDGTLPADGSGHGSNTDGQVRATTVALGREETQALLQRVPAAYRTRINDILLAALALTFRAWTGRDAHRIDLEGHGREEWVGDVDLSRTVGWFTTLYPVVLDLAGTEDEGSALKAIKEGLRRVPHAGLSYGLLRYGMKGREGAPGLAGRPAADLLFNYLGQFDQVVAGSELFGFAHEPTGAWHGPTNERTHRFEVVALIRDGRFEAQWMYGAERDRPELVERLAQNFIGELRRLIAHCTEPGVSGYTPSDFPLARLDQAALDRLAAQHPDMEDVYPLSPMQRLFLSMESGSARLGFEQWVFRLRGPLDAEALRAAWEDILARHAMLRTAFVSDGFPEPLQVVKQRVRAPWAQEDWRGRDPIDRRAAMDSWLRLDRERGFDVGEAPLHRVMLIRLAEDDHQLVWSTHHLYVDGWSWPLIFGDVGKAYEARVRGVSPRLPAPCQYRSFVAWLDGAAPDSREFWKDRLSGFTSPTPLPFEATATHDGGEIPREASIRLGPAATAELQMLARACRVTLSTIVQAAWAALLAHLSGREEVVFGAAFSGRPAELEGIETLVGPCVNNLPVSVRLDPDQRVSEWLSGLHTRNTEIAEHQYASVAEIQEWAGVPWRLRLFDSLLVFQNYVVDEAVLRLGAVVVEPVVAPDSTNYPLTLTVTPGPDLDLKLVGQANLFGRASLSMMLDGLTAILAQIASPSDVSLREILASLPTSTKGMTAAAPAGPPRMRSATYAAPVGEMERAVADVWQDLFQVDQIGMDDNFFDFGGHSILLLQAHARLREKLDHKLPVVALLQYPTIRSLARHLSGGERVEHRSRRDAGQSATSSVRRWHAAALSKGSANRCPIQTPTTLRTASRSSASPAASRAPATWRSSGRTSSQGRETVSHFSEAELDPALPDEMAARREPNYVRARGVLEDVELFDAGFFGITRGRGRGPRPSAARVPGDGVGGTRVRGSRSAEVRRPDRRLRGDEQQHLLPATSSRSARRHRDRRLVDDDDGQREGLSRHAGGLQARPARPGTQRPNSVLDVAGGGQHGGTEPAQLPVRHGAGRGRLDHAPAEARVSASGRRDHVARRALPDLRRARRRHRLQQRRGHRGPEAT